MYSSLQKSKRGSFHLEYSKTPFGNPNQYQRRNSTSLKLRCSDFQAPATTNNKTNLRTVDGIGCSIYCSESMKGVKNC